MKRMMKTKSICDLLVLVHIRLLHYTHSHQSKLGWNSIWKSLDCRKLPIKLFKLIKTHHSVLCYKNMLSEDTASRTVRNQGYLTSPLLITVVTDKKWWWHLQSRGARQSQCTTFGILFNQRRNVNCLFQAGHHAEILRKRQPILDQSVVLRHR